MKNFIFLIFLFFSLFSNAQEHPNWVNYTSTRSVKKVVQNKNTLWIATTGGLIKHDLRTQTNQYFNRGNSSIPSNDINDLLLDKNYDLWVATSMGIARFDGQTWTDYLDKIGGWNAYVLTLNALGQVVVAGSYYSLQTLIDDEFVITPNEYRSHIYPTDMVTNPLDGSLWVTAFDYGQFNICRYQDTTVQCFDNSNSILPMGSPRLNSLAVDQHGTVWADGGFYKKLEEDWEIYVPTDSLQSGSFLSPAIGVDNHLWYLTLSIGHEQLVELDEEYRVIRKIDLPEAINYHSYEQHLYLSPNPNYDIYVSSANDGLWRFKNDTWEQMDIHADFEIGNHTEQIFHTKDNTWIRSSYHNQIDSEFNIRNIDNNEWSNFSNTLLPDSLQEIRRTGIVNQLGDDTLQIFVHTRTWFYHNSNWIDANLPDVSPFLDENRSIIHFDPDGRRWVLDKWSGFVLYESPTGWKIFESSEHGNSSGSSTGYFNHPITGEFWMAGYSGISIYDGQAWRHIKPSEESDLIRNDRISDLVVTSEGIVWAVQPDNLLRIEGTDIQIIREINGEDLRHSLHSIELDKNENIWLGMSQALGHLKNETWTIYDTKNSGVISGRIYQLAIDKIGNIWMGGYNGGLSIFNPNGLSESFFINKTEISSQENETLPISIFPNPHSRGSRLCINLPETFSTNDTTLGIWYNALGQEVGRFTTKERLTILPSSDFSGWSTGIYYLKLENNGEKRSEGVLVNQ